MSLCWNVGAMERSEAEVLLKKQALAANGEPVFCVRSGSRGLTLSSRAYRAAARCSSHSADAALVSGTFGHVPIAQGDGPTFSIKQAGRVLEAGSLEELLVALDYVPSAPSDALARGIPADNAPPVSGSKAPSSHHYEPAVPSSSLARSTLPTHGNYEPAAPSSALAGGVPVYDPPPVTSAVPVGGESNAPTNDESEWRIGADDLTMIDTLGQGNFGVVRRAKWHGIVVAVKQLRSNTQSATAEAEFRRELGHMRALQPHRHVVTFFGAVYEAGACTSIVVEFCSGGSLESALTVREPASEAVAAQWTKRIKLELAFGIACGVAHLHRARIVHRDLAARNVLLTTQDGACVAKVADFGLARAVEDASIEQATATIVGPIKWMAPEQLERRAYSSRSDVFAFGIVLFELFAMQRPWAGVSNNAVYEAVLRGERMAWPRSALRPIVQLAADCWAHDAGDRPSMAVVQARLEIEFTTS